MTRSQKKIGKREEWSLKLLGKVLERYRMRMNRILALKAHFNVDLS